MTQTRTAVRPATQPMVDFVAQLLNDRIVPDDLRMMANVRPLSFSAASYLIDTLKAAPRVANRTQVSRATSTLVPNTAPNEIREGIFTVADSDKNYVTLRVKRENWCGGKFVISWLSGSDNERSYTGFGFLTPSGIKVWPSRKDIVPPKVLAASQLLLTGDLDAARQEFFNLAEAFAVQSGNCLACLRRLTRVDSLRRGLGSDCAKQLGVI